MMWRFLTYIGYIVLFVVTLIVLGLLYGISFEAADALGVVREIFVGAVGGAIIIGLWMGIYATIFKRSRQAETLATPDEEKELETRIKVIEMETERKIANIDAELSQIRRGEFLTKPPPPLVSLNLDGNSKERARRVKWAVIIGVVSLIAGVFPLLSSLVFVVTAKNDSGVYFQKAEKMDYYHKEVKLIYLNKAIKINPTYTAAYHARGIVYLLRGNNDKAIQDFTKAIEIDPNFAEAYLHLGSAYYNKGDYNEALKNYRMALKIAPNDKWICEVAKRSIRDVKLELKKRR